MMAGWNTLRIDCTMDGYQDTRRLLLAQLLFSFSICKTTDADRFAEVMLQIVGKRLTYYVLTAKSDVGFMGIR